SRLPARRDLPPQLDGDLADREPGGQHRRALPAARALQRDRQRLRRVCVHRRAPAPQLARRHRGVRPVPLLRPAHDPRGRRLAWRLIDEGFMKNQKVFSDAKIRLSYGVTGNQEIGLYNSLATLSGNNYAFGGTNVIGYATSSAAPNPDLKWETTRQTNLGLDLGWLNNRISASIDAYKSTTRDLLL